MLYHTDIYINKINILKTFTFTFEFLYFEFLDIFLSTCKRWNSVYELKDVGSLAAGKKCRFILTIFVMISPKDTEHKNYSDDECIDWVYCVNSLFFSLFHSLESLDPVAWEWIIVLFFVFSSEWCFIWRSQTTFAILQFACRRILQISTLGIRGANRGRVSTWKKK